MTRFDMDSWVKSLIERAQSRGYSNADIREVLETAAQGVGGEFNLTDRFLAIGPGSSEILRERERQIAMSSELDALDDVLVEGELVVAAVCYAKAEGPNVLEPVAWPLGHRSWDPGSRRSNLVRAGALIAAELDRLDRSGES